MADETPVWRILPGKAWGPVELGMSHQEAKAAILRAGGELLDDEEDITYLETEEPWGDFEFDGPGGALSRIIVLDSSLYFGDERLEKPTLDAAITAIGARSFNDTRWTHRDLKHPLPDNADIELLRSGTLWIPSQGIGFEMYRGKVEEVKICRSQDVPDSDLGQLTPHQLELAIDDNPFREAVAPAPKPQSAAGRWVSRFALLLFLLFMGLQCYRAYLAETRWSGAVPIEGEIVQTLPPGDTFPDAYVVKYEPPNHQPQQITVKSQFIGGLLPIGKKVEIRYRPDRPEEATTIWEAREHGFVDFIPSLLALAAVYLAASAVILLVVK
jgi:hypothetical protein